MAGVRYVAGALLLLLTATSDVAKARSPTLVAPSMSAYIGNNPKALHQFEQWLGRPAGHISAYAGRINWRDWMGSIGWLIGVWTPVDKPIVWSVPMFPKTGNLGDAAAGAYNDFYREAAKVIARSRRDDDSIYIRTGEEFNGDWMPWAAAGREQAFIQAYRNFVQQFRSVSGRFKFEWNVNIGQEHRMDPTSAYPGDDVVDVIGMNFFWDGSPVAAAEAWEFMLKRPFGLQWLEDFAAKRNKPTAYPEWGINFDNAGAYIANAAAWFRQRKVLYQTYWNSNADFAGRLSDGQYPSTGAAFIEYFGERSTHGAGAKP